MIEQFSNPIPQHQRISEPDSPLITRFRKAVFVENGADDSEVEYPFTRREVENRFVHLQSNQIEEIYKFSQRKWNSIKFNCLETLAVEGQVVMISGCKIYGPYLRVMMHHYCLPSVRKFVHDLTWCKGGILDNHVEYAQANHLEGIFFSVYTHNRTLERFVDYLSSRRTNINKPLLGKFERIENPLLFNGVPQFIFHHLFPATSSRKFDLECLSR